MSMSTDQLTLARMYLADPGTSSVQSLTIDNATGGTFTLTFSGRTTSGIAWVGLGANTIQNALSALSNIGLGQIEVIQTSTPNAVGAVYFNLCLIGTLGNSAQPMFTCDTSLLTGVGVTSTVSQVLAGGIRAFSDTDLNLLYSDAQSNFSLAIAKGYDALVGDANKFNNYVAGQTKEDKAQIRDHVKDSSVWWHQWANADRQFLTATIVPEPPRLRAVPWNPSQPATSLTYAPPYGPRSAWRGRSGW